MKSMTGYGRGEAAGAGCRLTVELSAVNSRKQVDMRFSIPKELGLLEPLFRQRISQKLSRGSLYVAVSYQLEAGRAAGGGLVNREMARLVADELRRVAQENNLAAPTMADVLAVPGVIDTAQSTPYEPLKALVAPALDDAIAALLSARLAEGERLKSDLIARGNTIRELLERIIAREPEALQHFQERLRARLNELGTPLPPDDERLAKELAFYAEKSDITEETIRLRSHLVKYAQLMESDGDPGRELDFLGQEMNREITTLSSKTADLAIAGDALALKIELSKIREQIMNIE